MLAMASQAPRKAGPYKPAHVLWAAAGLVFVYGLWQTAHSPYLFSEPSSAEVQPERDIFADVMS